MISKIPELVVNVKLAEILSEILGVDARAERVKGRKRPDIRCFYKGLIIGIEASYSKSDAERDAEARIKQGLVDIALALHIKEYYKDMPETKLKERIKQSRFDVKIFISRRTITTLINFLKGDIKMRPEPITGWFVDVDLPTLKTIIDKSIEFLAKEKEIQKLIKETKQKIEFFTRSLASIDRRGDIRRKIYDILYKLYGLSVAEAEDPEVAFGHVALSILLSAVFYEHVRGIHTQLTSLREYIEKYGPIEGYRKALEDLLKIDYRTAIEITIEILKILPPNLSYRVGMLIDHAIKIVQNRGVLEKDFAGRIYHEITGDIALRKGFATFYTEIPAAYLLATLATEVALELDKRNVINLKEKEARDIIEKMSTLKIGDFACGSGTLITASYYSLYRIVTALKYYYNMDDVNLEDLGKVIIENNIYGIDALRYASQITAINLALIGPESISKENVYTIYLGYIPKKAQAWLGSLELLDEGGKVGGVLAFIKKELKGIAEKVSLEGTEGTFRIPDKFGLIIMNPPFTRPTYRGKKKVPEEKRAFFGFITDKDVREKLRNRYGIILKKITNDLRKIAGSDTEILNSMPSIIKEVIQGEANRKLEQFLRVGLAGEALPFLYLAYKYIDNNGVIAFVLPRAVLAGVSWFLMRILLASKFHLRYVIVSSDPQNGYNFSEGTNLSEVLLVAKRVDKHDPLEKTTFVILTRKPKTALEGMLLAEEIKKAEKTKKTYVALSAHGAQCIVRSVIRENLLKNIDNWNRLIAISEPTLNEYMFRLLEEHKIVLKGSYIKIPLIRLGEILKTVTIERKRGKKVTKIIKESVKAIGIDSNPFYKLYTSVPNSSYPALLGTEEKYRLTMRIKPNAYIAPKSTDVEEQAKKIFDIFAGRILIPGVNIWWDTSHVIVLYSDERILSNTHYAIALNVQGELEPHAEKALVLWFNTTWGLLTILINREETRGPWTQVKMGQWLLMPVLDVISLDRDTVKRLADVFDKYANKRLRRIPLQFNPKNPDPVRLEIDINFLKVLSPDLDTETIKEHLLDIYKHVDVALKQWIG